MQNIIILNMRVAHYGGVAAAPLLHDGIPEVRHYKWILCCCFVCRNRMIVMIRFITGDMNSMMISLRSIPAVQADHHQHHHLEKMKPCFETIWMDFFSPSRSRSRCAGSLFSFAFWRYFLIFPAVRHVATCPIWWRIAFGNRLICRFTSSRISPFITYWSVA